MSRPLLAALFVLCGLTSHSGTTSRYDLGVRRIVITAPELGPNALEELSAEPARSVLSAKRIGNSLELTVTAGARLKLTAKDTCPLSISDSPSAARDYRLIPKISLSGPAGDVGYDANFEIRLRALCGSKTPGSIAWSADGAPLAELIRRDDGYRVTGRTLPGPARLASAAPGSILPMSPRDRAETRVTAQLTEPDGSVASASFSLAAAPRSRGLPNVALGERVLLGGTGYRLLVRPPGSAADPMPWGRLTSIVPDAEGHWELSHANGARLSLDVNRYDAVPLDCGRAECHAAQAHAAEGSQMSLSLARLLEGPHPPAAAACALACHTVGEPGAADGGFSHSLDVLELDGRNLPAWEALPRALRRTGGVGCVGCHGPGHVPEPGARWTLLRSDVCAYCHDSLPRYGHVSAWQSSSMARSDHFEKTRITAACARCHTTWGFLDALTTKPSGARMPPSNAGALGIGCVACHAVHSEDAVAPGLLRRVPLAPVYADLPASALERSGACIYCHTPLEGHGPSSASIWSGRGAQDPMTAAEIVGPAPHAAVPGGCVGCHDLGPAGLSRGKNHGFLANRSRCTGCHAARATNAGLFERGERLVRGQGGAPRSLAPAHADPVPLDTPRARALALVRLVLEDRGARVHNPKYAEALLDRAESVLSRPP